MTHLCQSSLSFISYGDRPTQPHLPFRCPDIDYNMLYSTLNDHDSLKLHRSVNNYVLELLYLMEDSVVRMLDEYFRTVGSCLPMISRKETYHRLSHAISSPRIEFALLLMSMNLALQPPPPPSSGASAPRSSVY